MVRKHIRIYSFKGVSTTPDVVYPIVEFKNRKRKEKSGKENHLISNHLVYCTQCENVNGEK